jgi:hypothetical protein
MTVKLSLDKETVRANSNDYLGMKEVSVEMVSRLLADEQEAECVFRSSWPIDK